MRSRKPGSRIANQKLKGAVIPRHSLYMAVLGKYGMELVCYRYFTCDEQRLCATVLTYGGLDLWWKVKRVRDETCCTHRIAMIASLVSRTRRLECDLSCMH